MLELIITDKAEHDLDNILEYTVEWHGLKQAKHYLNTLNQYFDLIRSNPYIGYLKQDIPKGYRALNAEKHVIVYLIKDNTLYIIRVLHSSRNFKQQSYSIH